MAARCVRDAASAFAAAAPSLLTPASVSAANAASALRSAAAAAAFAASAASLAAVRRASATAACHARRERARARDCDAAVAAASASAWCIHISRHMPRVGIEPRGDVSGQMCEESEQALHTWRMAMRHCCAKLCLICMAGYWQKAIASLLDWWHRQEWIFGS